MTRFVLVNFLTAAVAVAAWRGGLMGWAADLPLTTWEMLAALGAVWLGAIAFTLAGWRAACFHASNMLPMLGLIMTGIGIQLSGHSITQLTPESAFVLFRGILQSMSTTFVALALMVHVRERAFWIHGEHI